ncbi:response regulator [Azospirillum sp. SYSU D00513]|uniref:response regulator n=1 Tax=Azospirillum sp. SYSU D00513 TaxID=2812561 RepID=UPI001A976B0E|nr:response regulator [Azospirillum sp. SYSU D00513]
MSTLSKPHVVLAEDECLLSSLLREVLEDEGYRATVTENGKEALEADNADPADILLKDLRMPVLDGNTLIQLIRLRRPALPIVVVTGYDVKVPEWEQDRLTMLRKPFDHGALLRAMQSLLAAGRTTNAG